MPVQEYLDENQLEWTLDDERWASLHAEVDLAEEEVAEQYAMYQKELLDSEVDRMPAVDPDVLADGDKVARAFDWEEFVEDETDF